MQPIFLKPVFKDRIWGGTKLRDLYGYEIPSEQTGECWAVSAHPNGQSVVVNGEYAGTMLGDLWEKHPKLFGSNAAKFPLLTKILDASDDLSVQVHPEDAYAMANENGELGKTECWYIVDAEPGAEIIYGHKAATKEQLTTMIQQGQWDELLERVPVKAGDFFYVPSGTIHALGKGIVVLETQQSSDTTYRVYDYDRRDAEGNLRELHLDKAIEVTTVPHASATTEYRTDSVGQTQVVTYVSNSFFTVQKWNVDGPSSFEAPAKFTIFSVLSGEGKLIAGQVSYELTKGDHFLLPLGFEAFQLDGTLELIVSHE
ncbi:mannose-6-phosphate isomerase, class I [Paenibacillus hexagrammi]|uniref:Mannose-6-phosphate isomerase n=1 Tax=Paenibacillus hexagrammi TaxID=2908839 RepID=A0ABY3SLX0_9BACL|nr:mannose-6-phosphate isomerase, class I [Paenibacillus sp. YPD9-1]UJF34946.1 mannose-6-phosphate isomerase, class I [Paenibacillus sp. YPD9-1]